MLLLVCQNGTLNTQAWIMLKMLILAVFGEFVHWMDGGWKPTLLTRPGLILSRGRVILEHHSSVTLLRRTPRFYQQSSFDAFVYVNVTEMQCCSIVYNQPNTLMQVFTSLFHINPYPKTTSKHFSECPRFVPSWSIISAIHISGTSPSTINFDARRVKWTGKTRFSN